MREIKGAPPPAHTGREIVSRRVKTYSRRVVIDRASRDGLSRTPFGEGVNPTARLATIIEISAGFDGAYRLPGANIGPSWGEGPFYGVGVPESVFILMDVLPCHRSVAPPESAISAALVNCGRQLGGVENGGFAEHRLPFLNRYATHSENPGPVQKKGRVPTLSRGR